MNELFNLSVIKTLRCFGNGIAQEDNSSKRILQKSHKTRRKAYITHGEFSKNRARGRVFIGERKEVLSFKFREEDVRQTEPPSERTLSAVYECAKEEGSTAAKL